MENIMLKIADRDPTLTSIQNLPTEYQINDLYEELNKPGNWDACFDTMEKEGGNFVKQLRLLFFAADLNNRYRLLREFHLYFREYLKKGLAKAKQREDY